MLVDKSKDGRARNKQLWRKFRSIVNKKDGQKHTVCSQPKISDNAPEDTLAVRVQAKYICQTREPCILRQPSVLCFKSRNEYSSLMPACTQLWCLPMFSVSLTFEKTLNLAIFGPGKGSKSLRRLLYDVVTVFEKCLRLC